jgi:glycosyltransferase involved in cell wall biosynthesis
MTSVSIALATFNGEEFLAEQLKSLAEQTRLPDELVVTDDGSTDDTLAILERFARDCPFPIHIDRNPQRLGLNRNFERAISKTSADIVLISDQDDVWYPDKIATVVEVLSRHPEAIALHHDEHILDQETGERLSGTLWDRTQYLGGWDRYLAAGNCTALRREAVELLRPFPPNLVYDEWINRLPDLLGARIVLAEPLQLWRRHGSNSSQPSVAEDRPSRLLTFRRFATADPRPGWSEYRGRLAAMNARIELANDALAARLGPARVERAKTDVERQMRALEARTRVASLPKPVRWLKVLHLWAGGFYKDFDGSRSAIKDMFVP